MNADTLHGESTPDGSTGLRERKKEQTREALAAAARTLFLERGFDSVTVDDGSPAMAVRGRRVAVLHSYLASNSMAFFVGDTTPIPSTDIIVADSVLESAGSGSTLVLNQVERSVVVDSWITNPVSFGYVVSGESDQTFARENVLIGGDGHLQLADFGLSKALAADEDTTSTFCGSPEYIAPEILEGEPYGCEARPSSQASRTVAHEFLVD